MSLITILCILIHSIGFFLVFLWLAIEIRDAKRRNKIRRNIKTIEKILKERYKIKF